MMKKMQWISLLGLLPALAGAAPDFAKTPQEDAMCQALIYNGHDTSDRENWMHMHHYCDCIRFTNRAYASVGRPQDVIYNLENAIDGCDYVLSHTKPDFFMRPEVHVQKGMALILAKRDYEAVEEFLLAIKGNPGLVKAYFELGRVQKRLGMKQEALKTVTDGLRFVPNSKALQSMYTELGGKLPYPEPLIKKTEPAVVTTVRVETPLDAPQVDVSGTATESSPPAEKPVDAATLPPEPPKIGTPKNPYCRFCAD
jgi:tetratricopeptide (TPR) repeat protein